MLLGTTDSYVRSSQAEPLTVDVMAGHPRGAGEPISLSASGRGHLGHASLARG
jgi:hypothetical protein